MTGAEDSCGMEEEGLDVLGIVGLEDALPIEIMLNMTTMSIDEGI